VRRELAIEVSLPETRAALLEDGRVVEVLHERRRREGIVGNVYLGRVHRVLPGMQAAFVSIGLERDAFLYVEDAMPRDAEVAAENGGEGSHGPARTREDVPRIDDLVKEGQEIVVQAAKDAIGGKGPRVTTAISLPGRTLVHLPGSRGVGISRRILDEAERDRLRSLIEALPGGGGWIARTAAQGASAGELEADRVYLVELAARIARKSEEAGAPTVLHRELDLSLRVLRDMASPELAAVLVDDEEAAARLSEFARAVSPAIVARIELWRGERPMFSALGVEAEIERALKNRVSLASGGSLVIQQTEALVAIDVNTGRYVGKDALEETVFATNLEAVPEVARQIRLRDLGGLLVVDFIDMEEEAHRREIFDRFVSELSRDRARTRVLPMSEFGLIEVTRQRSRGNLERTLTRPCPACGGAGRVRNDTTLALDLLRALKAERGLFQPGEEISVRVPPSLWRLLTDEESDLLTPLEQELNIRVRLQPDEAAGPAEFEIIRSMI
jgi:ribonuclease G